MLHRVTERTQSMNDTQHTRSDSGTDSNYISPKQVATARDQSMKKVIDDPYNGCSECGSEVGRIITYYDTLAPDRTCIACGHTY